MSSHFADADLERLDKAIAQGVLSVEFEDGRKVQFSTFAELVSRRNYVAQQLGISAGRQRMLGEFRKGVK